MNAVQNLAQCVARQVPEILPVFCHSELFDAAYRQVPYTVYSTQASAVVDCQVHAVGRFGWDWTWIHVDDVLELEPLGVVTSQDEGEPRRVVKPLPLQHATLRRLEPEAVLRAERLGVLVGALSELRATFGDSKIVCGRLTGPLTMLNLLFGPAAVEHALQSNHGLIREGLELAVEMGILLAEAQAAAGAHALWIDDRMACSDLVPPSLYESLVLQPTQRLLNAVRWEDIWGILHTGENDLAALKVHAGAGPDVLSLGPRLSLVQVHAALGQRVALMGNLDPVLLLTRAWPSQVAAYVDGLVRFMRAGGMILATAGPVPADARGPNLHVMVDTARKIWNIVAGH